MIVFNLDEACLRRMAREAVIFALTAYIVYVLLQEICGYYYRVGFRDGSEERA